MPYISTDEVKVIRNEIKKEFPGFKFSIKKHHWCGVNVRILKGSLNFKPGEHVNEYYIEEHWKDKPAQKEMLLKLRDIITKKHIDCVHEDSDYGSIPNFYYGIFIGDYQKPYLQI